MDPNGDGLACTGGDLFTAAGDQYAAADQYAAPVDQYAAPQTHPLPATGGPALVPIVGVLLVAVGVLGLRMLRRS